MCPWRFSLTRARLLRFFSHHVPSPLFPSHFLFPNKQVWKYGKTNKKRQQKSISHFFSRNRFRNIEKSTKPTTKISRFIVILGPLGCQNGRCQFLGKPVYISIGSFDGAYNARWPFGKKVTRGWMASTCSWSKAAPPSSTIEWWLAKYNIRTDDGKLLHQVYNFPRPPGSCGHSRPLTRPFHKPSSSQHKKLTGLQPTRNLQLLHLQLH